MAEGTIPGGANPHRMEREEQRVCWKWAVAIIAAAASIVFAAGTLSDVVLGDEPYHFMFARAWADAGLWNRPTHNPLYPSGAPSGYWYVTEPVWPMLLAALWQATGPVPWVAQLYQAAFYALLLAMVYRLGRHFLGPRGALAALLVAVSVPMAGAFSVMLHLDIPSSAIILAALVLVVDRRLFWAGVLVGLAYLTKRNTVFLAPPMVLWILMEDGSWGRRLSSAAMLLLPAALVVLPDFFWRWHAIPGTSDPVNPAYVLARFMKWFSAQRLPSNINNPLHLLQYLGAVIPALLGLYVIRRTWQKADRWLWALLAFYLVTLVLFFPLDTDVRYVMPAVPILAVLAARGLAGWWQRRWVLGLVGVVAFAHLGAAGWVTYQRRHLTPSQRAVFAYLRENTPEGPRVLYPGESIMIEARRPVVWNHLTEPETREACITPFLIQYGPEKMLAVLRANRVDYICVDEKRILSGPLAKAERGGYPRAFVDRLPTLPFLENISGDWPGVELWRVKEEPLGEVPDLPERPSTSPGHAPGGEKE